MAIIPFYLQKYFQIYISVSVLLYASTNFDLEINLPKFFSICYLFL